MPSPSLELVNDCHIYLSGDVVVHPSAAIAPGVLLQADPGSRLTIAAGVCIGQGVILHAHQGTLSIESGATLGSGVLIVGQGSIGSNACIGPLTTIVNSSIEPNQIVPPQTLLGETGRQVPLSPAEPTVWGNAVREDNGTSSLAAESPNGATSPSPAPASPLSPSPPARKSPTQVYGQAYVERFMITMFPHRRQTEDLDQTPNSGEEQIPDPWQNSSPPAPPS